MADNAVQYGDDISSLSGYGTAALSDASAFDPAGSAASLTLSNVLASSSDANALPIQNLANPTDAQDAATKSYVDGLLSSVSVGSITNLVITGDLSVTNVAATNVISGVTTITYIPEQGDLGMGSYTNQPGL